MLYARISAGGPSAVQPYLRPYQIRRHVLIDGLVTVAITRKPKPNVSDGYFNFLFLAFGKVAGQFMKT